MEVIASFRTKPPLSIAGQPVTAICDYLLQLRHEVFSGDRSALNLPKTDMIRFELDSGDRILIRPSGTEPKIKLYFETIVPKGEIGDLAQGRRLAEKKIALLAEPFRKLIDL